MFSAGDYAFVMDEGKDDETQLGVRMSKQARELIERAAKKDRRKPSTWVRLRAVSQARAEIGGAAPPVEPDDEEVVTLLALREIEALDTALPGALISLGRAAKTRPHLVLALKELALALHGGGPPGIAERVRKGRRGVRAMETE